MSPRGRALLLACCAAIHPVLAAAEPPAPALDQTELNNRGVSAAQAGRFDEGVQWLRQALALNAQDALTRKNLSGVLTDWAAQLERQGRTDEAIAALREATTLDPGHGPGWVRLGDLLYMRRDATSEAVHAWKQALPSAPTAVARELADRVKRVQRDHAIEQGFIHGPLQTNTPHFLIRFEQAHHDDLQRFTQVLEEQYARLSAILGVGPSRLTVIVYSARDIQRVSTKRDWAIGLYDGRIRLRVDELTQPWLDDVVAHELTHAFLHHRSSSPLPMWVHEGYAQAQERPREAPPEMARMEDGVRSRASWIPLKWLDRRFGQPADTGDVFRAYVQSRLVVQELIDRHGMPAFTAFLDALGRGADIEEAYEQAFAPSRWSRADMGHLD